MSENKNNIIHDGVLRILLQILYHFKLISPL